MTIPARWCHSPRDAVTVTSRSVTVVQTWRNPCASKPTVRSERMLQRSRSRRHLSPLSAPMRPPTEERNCAAASRHSAEKNA